jgi:hypothetical protein
VADMAARHYTAFLVRQTSEVGGLRHVGAYLMEVRLPWLNRSDSDATSSFVIAPSKGAIPPSSPRVLVLRPPLFRRMPNRL